MSKAKAPRVFVPLTKVDEEQRLVYGRITSEEVDQSGEVMDYDTSKPNFEKWSNQIETASGGLSKGNLRVMHGLSVAGKLTDIAFDDEDKSIEVCAKVVDESEWDKVLEGCYTGFSVGGKYGKKWKDTVNGSQITKFTAVPNEVSLVDNPCVKSATFALVKADGAEEAITFKNAEVEEDQLVEEETKEPKTATTVEKAVSEPSNADVAARAEELAKAANDGSTWMQHIEAARDELIKAQADEKDDDKEEAEDEGTKTSDKKAAKKSAKSQEDESEEDEDEEDSSKADFTIADRLSQKWTCSDGTAFDKKADAETHEAELVKAAEQTEADKLRDRLKKATEPKDDEEEQLDLFEDFDRMGKVINALSTPFEEGEPKLEKGLLTVSRFANVLWDLGSLQRSIKKEGKKEDGDEVDYSVSDDIKAAIQTLGESMKTYLDDQLTELLAGLDDEACVSYYDYYYAAAQENGEDQLAKDVCEILESKRDDSRERRETLSKAFGYVEAELVDDGELSPPMQKRFDDLTKNLTDMTKVATDAIEKVEELTKRVQAVEDTPLPRAPGSFTALKEGDFSALGKATTQEEKVAALHDMLKTHGPDQLATMMIKAVHAGGGQQLNLQR